MKIFADSVNISQIIDCLPFIDGVTTNPNLMKFVNLSKLEFTKEITSKISNIPISIQVKDGSIDNMIEEGISISKISANAVIKIPMTKNGLIVAKELSKNKIPVNVTLCFSLPQAILAAKMGVTYVSPFMARLDDICASGFDLIKNIRNAYDLYGYKTEIIAASIRANKNLEQAIIAGSHIATISPSLILSMMNHPLTMSGLREFELSESFEE